MKKNYYELIGLAVTASQSEIDDVFIALSKKLNSSKEVGNLNAKIKFKELEEAYETLGNPEKRAVYNEMLLKLIRNSKKPEPEKVESIVINPFLVLGILFMPYIFCWFLLRKGYSNNLKLFGFGYMVLMVACVLVPTLIPNNVDDSTKAASRSKPDERKVSDVEDNNDCVFTGMNLATAYFANLPQAVEVGMVPSTVMTQGCTKKMKEKTKDQMYCYKTCEEGFKYKTKSFLNN